MNAYQYGYAGIGLCHRCSSPAHLWVHSYIDNCDTHCMNCLVRVLTHYQRNRDMESSVSVRLSYSLDNLPTLNPDISVPLCKACNEPEFLGSVSTCFVEGLWNDLESAIVHIRCTWKCEDCDKRYLNHDRSDSEHSLAYAEVLDGRDRCPTCVDSYIAENGGQSNFFTCDNCDERHTRDDMRVWNGRDICSYCYDNNVNECDDCGNYYWYGNRHDCEYDNDDDNDNNSVIHHHSYRPSPEFFGSGNYHLGFELEIESRNSSRYEGAEFVQQELGAHAYIKEDGSLSDGFEIVTHPHTLSEYQSNFNWGLLDKLKRRGYRSWNTDTCGIHIHISRTAFETEGITNRSRRIMNRQAHELRFMKLIYDNQRQVERISGRTDCHYASFLDKGNLVPKVKEGYQNNGRYSAVNTENDATLEVRVFKGSLRKERVLSAIEFVTASVEYTRGLSVNGKNRALGWLHFTAYISANVETYPNLALIMAESFNTDTQIDGLFDDN